MKVPSIFQIEVCKINDLQGFIVRSANPNDDVLVTTSWDKVMQKIGVVGFKSVSI